MANSWALGENEGWGPWPERNAVEKVAWSGASAARNGFSKGVQSAVNQLIAQIRSSSSWWVASVLGDLVVGALTAAWNSGWQAREAVHQVGRHGRDAHARLIVAALASPECWREARGATMPESWSSQLAALGVGDHAGGDNWLLPALAENGRDVAVGLRVFLETLGELLQLYAIESIVPPPRDWRFAPAGLTTATADDALLAKIRGLLAKAESTTFEPEAEALTAKAQVLMARHAINDAVLRGDGGEGQPITRRVPVDDPYADPKSSLLSAVAKANGARSIWYPRYALMAVVGYPNDLDAIEALFTSLLVQAGRALLAKRSVVDGLGRSETRSFRQSFLASYANRIRERLQEAADQARREAEEEMSTSLLPVLASRDREVDEAVAKVFPHLTRYRSHASTNAAGWQAGRIAAETATLGPDRGRLNSAAAS